MKLTVGSPISAFTKTLLPNFSSSTVLSQIELLRNELRDNILPLYKNALDIEYRFVGKVKWKSKWAQAVSNKLYQEAERAAKVRSNSRAQNIIELIFLVLEKTVGHLDHLSKLIEKSFSDDISAVGLTYKQANLIRLVELTEFFLVMARRLLLNILHNEALMIDGIKTPPFVKGDVKWMEDHLTAFAGMLNVYGQEKEDLVRATNNLPDIEISDDPNDQALVAAQTGLNQDALRIGFIPYVLNPIYHVRNAILHWRHNRLEAARLEKEQIELRLEMYRLRLNGQNNAKTEEIIENVTERLKKQNQKIAEMEKTWEAAYGS